MEPQVFNWCLNTTLNTYNLGVMAVGPCGVNTTAAISLSYGEAYVGAEETASAIIVSMQL